MCVLFLLNNLSGFVTSWPHLRVQEAGNTQLSLSQAEGQAVVGEDVGRVEALIVQEMRPEVMDDGAECEAVPEGSWQVLNPHIVVVRHNPSCPDLNKRFSCRLELTNLPWELWHLGPPLQTSSVWLGMSTWDQLLLSSVGSESWHSANSNIHCSMFNPQSRMLLLSYGGYGGIFYFFNFICLFRFHYQIANCKL